MSTSVAIWILLGLAIVGANLPWVSDRILFFRQPSSGEKRIWWSWLEWLLLYFIVGGIAIGLEQKLNGERYAQDWEFYAVTFCLFLVFALPGFIYRYDLKKLLAKRR